MSENRLIQQRRGPRVQPPTNNDRMLARNCGAKDCRPQGADRAARVAPPSRASIRLQRAERGVSIWGAAGAVLVIAAQRGVCVRGVCTCCVADFHLGVRACLPFTAVVRRLAIALARGIFKAFLSAATNNSRVVGEASRFTLSRRSSAANQLVHVFPIYRSMPFVTCSKQTNARS